MNVLIANMSKENNMGGQFANAINTFVFFSSFG